MSKQPTGQHTATPWVVEYDNDTGPNDDAFFEWWNVTNGTVSYRCNNESEADALRDRLNVHDELVKACESALSTGALEHGGVADILRAVLAKAQAYQAKEK